MPDERSWDCRQTEVHYPNNLNYSNPMKPHTEIFTPGERNELSALVTSMILSSNNTVWFHSQLEQRLDSLKARGLTAAAKDYQRHNAKMWITQMGNVSQRVIETLQQNATFDQADQVNELSEYVAMAMLNLLALPTELRIKAIDQMTAMTEEYANSQQKNQTID